MGSGSTQSLSAERPMVPPSTEKIVLLRSASERRWSLTTRSRSVWVPRLKKAPSVVRTYNASIQATRRHPPGHGSQSHFPHYVRESGQGLRGVRPQGEPGGAVRLHRGRGAGVRRTFLGGAGPFRGAHQGRVLGREAHLAAHALDPAHRRGEETGYT